MSSAELLIYYIVIKALAQKKFLNKGCSLSCYIKKKYHHVRSSYVYLKPGRMVHVPDHGMYCKPAATNVPGRSLDPTARNRAVCIGVVTDHVTCIANKKASQSQCPSMSATT